MGKAMSKCVTRNEVNNVINTSVVNCTNNITNIVNSTITKTTTNIVNSNVATATTNIGGGNIQNNNKYTIGNGNNIDFTQTLEEQATFKACQDLMNSTTALQQLTTEIIAKAMATLKSDATAVNSTYTLAAIKEATEKSGGLSGLVEKMFNVLPDIIGKISGASSDKETINIISNVINVSLTNITNNTQNISTLISTDLETNLSNTNKSTCGTNIGLVNSNANNIYDIGNDNNLNFSQSISLNSTIDCIQTNANSISITSKIIEATTGLAKASVENIINSYNKQSTEFSYENIEKIVPNPLFGSFPGGCPCGNMDICGMSCCTLLIILLVCMLFPSIIGIIWKFWPKGKSDE
jgi:hypothetical protein